MSTVNPSLLDSSLTPALPAARERLDIAPLTGADDAPAKSRSLAGAWPIAALVAGPASFAMPFVFEVVLDHSTSDKGPLAVYQAIADKGTQAHIGMDLAFVAAVGLGLFAAGFTRFVDARTPRGSSLGSLVRHAFSATLALAVLVAVLKAALRGGLPDHGDSEMYARESVGVFYTFIDQIQYTSLWPLVLAQFAVAALAFRYRALPRWYGALSGLLVIATLAMALALGLPYFAGLVGPWWLVASALVALRHRNRPVAA